jgi:FMN-dependent NADH-azoreductase
MIKCELTIGRVILALKSQHRQDEGSRGLRTHDDIIKKYSNRHKEVEVDTDELMEVTFNSIQLVNRKHQCGSSSGSYK